jgi:hypothetical protein
VLRLDTGTEENKVAIDERLLKLPSPSTLVTRLVFPLLPADSHAQDLAHVPFFGPDSNLDPFGARISREGKTDALVQLRGKEGEWRTYTKSIRLNAGEIMSAHATAVAEVAIDIHPLIRQAKKLTDCLFVAFFAQTRYIPPLCRNPSSQPFHSPWNAGFQLQRFPV